MSATDQSILKTLAYFDLFEYPLTTFEVWQWFWSPIDSFHELGGEPPSLADIDTALNDLLRSGRLEMKEGFWFLSGKAAHVETRRARHRLSIMKLARAKRLIRLFSWLPSIEGVAICNSLGIHNATAKSDIDVFVITSRGAIWSTRLFAAGIMALLGQRPTATHTADTICLSFFVSTEAMNLEGLKKMNGDPYFTFWLTQLLPIVGRKKIWQEFWEANRWVQKTLPNALPYQTQSPNFYKEKSRSRAQLLRRVEPLAKFFQRRRMPKLVRDHIGEGGDVVLSDQILKFHTNDRREEYRLRWEEHVNALQ